MTVLDGCIAASSAGGIVNPALTNAMHQFAVNGWPPSVARLGGTPVASTAAHFPVAAPGKVIAARIAGSYVRDYYFRIHVTPQLLALGNIVSTQVGVVRVWNAYFQTQTLLHIDGLDEGMAVEGGGMPLVITGLRESDWQVSVTPEGPAVVDVTALWVFDGVPAPSLRITGSRLVAWTFVPDWADGVLERLEWLTEILQSPTGAEQGRALRLAPRRFFEARLFVEDRERRLFDLALFDWSGRRWALPIWHDAQVLTADVAAGVTTIACDTRWRDFRAGGIAILRGASAFDYEAVQVEAVADGLLTLKRATQQTWPRGTRLYPSRVAQLQEQPQITRLTDRAVAVEVRFAVVETCDWTAAMPATLYRGYPVLADRPDESDDLTGTLQRLLLSLDNATGLPLLTDTVQRGFTVQSHRWLTAGRQQQATLRGLLYALNGRQSVVWVPTQADDVTLAATVASSATTLDIENIGYSRYGNARSGRRDLRIELRDGTVLHRRVTGATEIDSATERLSIDATPGRTIAVSDVARISWLALCRLDQDSVEIQHDTDSEGIALCQVIFRSVRDEL